LNDKYNNCLFLESQNKIYIFGESHYNKKSKNLINDKIKQLKPDFLLHELLYEDRAITKKEIKNRLDNSGINKICDPRLNKDIYELGYKYDIPLIGIDLGNLQDDLSLKEKFKIREKNMVNIIHEFYNRGLIMVVVGDTHLRTKKTKELGDISLIQKEFKNDTKVEIIRSGEGEIN
jgi:hypothetical protein